MHDAQDSVAGLPLLRSPEEVTALAGARAETAMGPGSSSSGDRDTPWAVIAGQRLTGWELSD
jgi:hypothetical protein